MIQNLLAGLIPQNIAFPLGGMDLAFYAVAFIILVTAVCTVAVKNILQKTECFFFSCAKYFVKDAPFFCYSIWTSCATKFRICCKSSTHMARHVYFWNYCDITVGCIFYYFS